MDSLNKNSITKKAHLRSTFLKERKLMTQDQVKDISKGILESFRHSFDLRTYKYVHVFLPIEKQNEIDTWPIVDYINQEKGQVVVSKSDLLSNNMEHFIYDKSIKVSPNKWGIPEPESGVQVSESQIDLVLIPLLVFDVSGHRVGYGKGYYDLFLSKCRNDCVKVGLSMVPPVELISEVEPTDVKMDYCISPKGLHTFGEVKK